MGIEQLVKKAKHGDKDALVALITAEKDAFYKLAYVYMKNREDAMDVMEDMIVIIYDKISSLRNDKGFYSWSKKILVNCCKKSLSKRKRITYTASIDEKRLQEDIGNKDISMLLETTLSYLNEKQQEAIKLRYYLDLDYETIALIVKAPVGTVKSRISTGLKKMKQYLGDDVNE